MIHQRKIIKAIAYAILLCFTSLTGAQPLYAIPANTQLPTGPGANGYGDVTHGVADISVTGNTMNIEQSTNTSVIQWDNFSIGADAAVNFVGSDGKTFIGMNSLNYVTGKDAPISEIYGQLTALGGNIFIANPAGVQIGNSAQINVGSIYVTNKDVSSLVNNMKARNYSTAEIESAIAGLSVPKANAELMSLGSIIAEHKVTFDGGRIVIDTDRLYKDADANQMETAKLAIRTTDKNDVILGYDAYNEAEKTFDGAADKFANFGITEVNENNEASAATLDHGYMWVRDLFQLQNMNTKLDGWYALRNSIDASYTSSAEYGDGEGFAPIGDSANSFAGRFDGLGYDIFGLNIMRPSYDNVGLFGYVGRNSADASVAYVRNLTINSGSIEGHGGVGSAIGTALFGSVVESITNTADVKGDNTVGGIIGTMSNSGEYAAEEGYMSDLINVGTVEGYLTVGGIIGNLANSTLDGRTYNLGAVKGIAGAEDGETAEQSHNIGGITGWSQNSKIGNDGDGFQIYNQGAVTGGYNVGGIAGRVSALSSEHENKITNVANHGTITANGHTEGTYSYHTAIKGQNNIPGTVVDFKQPNPNASVQNNLATVNVDVANVGGIVGSANEATIENVINDGDVSSSMEEGTDFYIAGNVCGVVGSAVNTTIKDATNSENSVAGAHNVGGIAGLLSGASSITNGTNDGGDITGTGARHGDNFVQERVRPIRTNNDGEVTIDEAVNIGNIGGIAGYMYGGTLSVKDSKQVIDNFIENSTNRGTVHSAYISEGAASVPESAKAANVGGIVGKVDMGTKQTMTGENGIQPGDKNSASGGNDYLNVSIRHSYNTGDVQGYTGVGGVAGMMYNGSVTRSFNTGNVSTTRWHSVGSEALNMGGIVGDTTEETSARTMIYDIYNAGQIGDSDYNYYGCHVGGVVGRLSGEIDKAYNTGDIYNGYSVTGGVVGWWYAGNITNVFNTGNITVVNYDTTTASNVGGLVGDIDSWEAKLLQYAYNLGTIRSFRPFIDDGNGNNISKENYITGIVGSVQEFTGNGGALVTIDNVYTLGNLYAGKQDAVGGKYTKDNEAKLSAIWNHGDYGASANVKVTNSVYIAPENKDIFTELNPAVTKIQFGERDESSLYKGMDIFDV